MRRRRSYCIRWLVFLTLAITFAEVPGAIVTDPSGVFQGNETTTTFNGLGLSFAGNGHPVAVLTNAINDGNTYHTEAREGTLQLLQNPGADICDECLATRSDGAPGAPVFIEVTLGTPVHSVSALVTGSADNTSWAIDVAFFQNGNQLVDNILLASNTAALQFAGWQTEPGVLIDRVVFTDSDANSRVFLVENFTFEVVVPIPPALLLFGSALISLRTWSRRALT